MLLLMSLAAGCLWLHAVPGARARFVMSGAGCSIITSILWSVDRCCHSHSRDSWAQSRWLSAPDVPSAGCWWEVASLDLAPARAPPQEKMLVEYDNARVLVTDMKIEAIKDIIPLLEQVTRINQPLLIIAEDVTGAGLLRAPDTPPPPPPHAAAAPLWLRSDACGHLGGSNMSQKQGTVSILYSATWLRLLFVMHPINRKT